MMEELLNKLYLFNCVTVIALFIFQNALIALVAVLLGFLVDGNLMVINKKVTWQEVSWTSSTVFFNSVITMFGYHLYKAHIVVFDFNASPITILIDFILLVLLMDLLMYLFHSVIHKVSFMYRYHDLHHRYNEPTAISLFVLHPVEVVGFGILWLILISTFTFSFYAIIIYLIFNVVMGIIGHLEKEFIPDFVRNNLITKWLGTTTFHRDHHSHEDGNYGFYTSFWDKIFGTWIKNNPDKTK